MPIELESHTIVKVQAVQIFFTLHTFCAVSGPTDVTPKIVYLVRNSRRRTHRTPCRLTTANKLPTAQIASIFRPHYAPRIYLVGFALGFSWNP